MQSNKLTGISSEHSGQQSALPEESSNLTLGRIWLGLIRRRRVVAAFAVLGILLGAVSTLRKDKFGSTAMLRIEPDRSSQYMLSAAQALGSSAADEKLNTETLILKSTGLLLRVAQDLDLANKPEFYAKAVQGRQSLSDPVTRDNVLALLDKALNISHFPKTEVISITCTTHSGLLSASIVNTLVNDYISNVLETRFGSTQRVSNWLIRQLDELKNQVQSDQERLVDLQNKLGLLAVDPKNSAYLDADALQELTRASSQATIARILAEARLRYLKDSDPNLIESEQPAIGNSQQGGIPLLQSLRADQAKAMADYASLTAKFKSNYPAVKEAKARLDTINQQVKTEEERILNQAQVAYSAASTNESMTVSKLNQEQKDAFKSRDSMVQYAILQREYESHRTLYEGLVQRLREAGINSGLQSASVDIVDLGYLPSRPNPPGRVVVIAACFFSMFFLGCLAAVIYDFRDAKFDTVEDAETALGLSGLCLLPLVPASEQSTPFVSIAHPTSHFSEGTQLLRNALLLSTPDKRAKLILVTSSWPREGKSTIAREMAATFAINGKKVLLIDGDMRKPSQHTRMGLKRSPGLSNVVNGSVSLESAIQRVEGVDGLSVLTAGPTPPQSSVLWNSESMRSLLVHCTDTFDFVILDTPPLLSVADAALAAPLADACILVVRQGVVDQRSVQQAYTLISRTGANLIGFVLNAVDFRWSGYSRYKYGYGSYGVDEETGKAGK